MSCACGCGNCGGLGEPWSTGSYVVAGSVIAWGGHIVQRQDGAAVGWTQDLEEQIKNALWNHGGFSMVNAGQIGGWINPYISIKVTTRTDFAQLADVFNVIQGAIYQAGYAPDAKAFVIESVPPSAANQPGIATPGTGGNTNPGPTSSGSWNWNLPSLDWPSLGSGGNGDGNPINTLANWLNVTPTQAALIGAGLAVGGVILLKRIL